MTKLTILRDTWKFMGVYRRWYLLPIVLLTALFSLVLIFAQTSPLAPVIYTIF